MWENMFLKIEFFPISRLEKIFPIISHKRQKWLMIADNWSSVATLITSQELNSLRNWFFFSCWLFNSFKFAGCSLCVWWNGRYSKDETTFISAEAVDM